MFVVDLKEYHRHMDSRSARSSQERQKFKLRFKIKENSSSSAIRTEANDVHDKNLSFLGKTYTKQHRTPTPTKLSKKTEEWKFISIQLK